MPRNQIAWGRKVSPRFKSKVILISAVLGCDPSHLMAAMAFETGETFSPSIRNPRSGAIGLIQFMPRTAKALGTTTTALVAMTADEQLEYVGAYFSPHEGRLTSLSDLYMAILWPRAVARDDAFVLFSAPQTAYAQNAGLDANRDGQVTKGEAAAKVFAKLSKGLSKELRG